MAGLNTGLIILMVIIFLVAGFLSFCIPFMVYMHRRDMRKLLKMTGDSNGHMDAQTNNQGSILKAILGIPKAFEDYMTSLIESIHGNVKMLRSGLDKDFEKSIAVMVEQQKQSNRIASEAVGILKEIRLNSSGTVQNVAALNEKIDFVLTAGEDTIEAHEEAYFGLGGAEAQETVADTAMPKEEAIEEGPELDRCTAVDPVENTVDECIDEVVDEVIDAPKRKKKPRKKNKKEM